MDALLGAPCAGECACTLLLADNCNARHGRADAPTSGGIQYVSNSGRLSGIAGFDMMPPPGLVASLSSNKLCTDNQTATIARTSGSVRALTPI